MVIYLFKYFFIIHLIKLFFLIKETKRFETTPLASISFVHLWKFAIRSIVSHESARIKQFFISGQIMNVNVINGGLSS